ncbi:hypothetical protein LTR10_005392 [Elasticomyces elasticus]|nr:hypothetical protein LTR10_005392 [Elasticomyces elasticus]
MSFDADHKSVDVECVEERADQTTEQQREEKALVRKIDLYLLPTIWIMYLLSYMDRTNVGNSSHMAQYMIYCVGITGYFSDKFPQNRGLIISCWLILSMICAIVICVVYNFTARYVLLVFMAAGLWSTNGCSLSYAASTFGSMEQETRAVSLALVNALGNLAQIYGAYLFPAGDKPKYTIGFGVISGMCAFGVIVYAAAHVLLRKYAQK